MWAANPAAEAVLRQKPVSTLFRRLRHLAFTGYLDVLMRMT
jgi:hypothetical protein